MRENKLEKKVFFRLIRITYILTLIIGELFVLFAGWMYKPYQEIDDDKSYAILWDGKKYTYSSIKEWLDKRPYGSNGEYFYTIQKKAKYLNDYTAAKDRQSHAVPSGLEKYIVYDSEKLTDVYKTSGSWVNVIVWWIVGSLGLYAILNIMLEGLLYIIFGKPFGFGWARIKYRKTHLIIFLALGIILSTAEKVHASSRVGRYSRRNGSYVAPNYRSTPNYSKFDNWSTKGNYNPYTGKKGYVKPYKFGRK